jgi:4-amino-4-deoxy-L-arabinose transferase-like glycosyltransferase
MIKTQKTTKILLLLIIALSLFLNLISLKSGHNWGDDFSMYIAQSKSIVENSVDNLIEQQIFLEKYSSELHGPFLYPWGFPVLLSPVYKIFGFNIIAMKIYVFLFFLGSLFILFFIFVDGLNERYRLLIVSLFALNPVFFYFKENVLSDVPFLFLTLLGMLLIKLFIIEKRFFINESISFFLLGFVVFYAYFTRPQGVVLFPILLICHFKEYMDLLNNKQRKFLRKEYIQLVPYLTVALCLALNKHLFYENFYYFVNVFLSQNIVETVKYNIVFYTVLPSEFFGSKTVFKLLYAVTVPFAIYGFIADFKKDYPFALFVIFNLSILLIFPYTTQGIRYIFFILPFYVYYFFKGFVEFKSISFKIPYKNAYVSLIYILIVTLMISYLLRDVNYVKKVYNDNYYTVEGPYSKGASEMINFIINSTKQNDKIVFFKPRALRLYTNRNTAVNYNIDEIVKYKLKYVVTYKYDVENDYRIKFVHDISESNLFRKIFDNDEYLVYELIAEDSGMGKLSAISWRDKKEQNSLYLTRL